MTVINPYIKNAIIIYECLFWIRTWRSKAAADASTAIHIITLIERYVGIAIKRSILNSLNYPYVPIVVSSFHHKRL